MTRPNIICLTPVKNEAWILSRFLDCASLWADHIIIADQNSTDNSKEIAQRYTKVTLLDNSVAEFDEKSRQKLLLAAARKIPEPRLIIALDADEMLTSNFMHHPEWETVLNAKPGTIIEFEWVNILPCFSSYWSPKNWYYPLGFIDDGSEHNGLAIHSPRIPEPPHSPRIRLHNIKVLHYQYVNVHKLESKRRWYQCWEILNKPSRRPVRRYRMYHEFHSFSENEIHSLKKEWFIDYEQRKIDMTSIYQEPIYWHDSQILSWIQIYGSKHFKKAAIWDINWENFHQKLVSDSKAVDCKDPRNWLDKSIHYWLKKTQTIRYNFLVRIVDKLLMLIGW